MLKQKVLLLLDTQHIFDRKVFEGFSSTLRTSNHRWAVETLSVDQCQTAISLNSHWDGVVANGDSTAVKDILAQLSLPTVIICGQPMELPGLHQNTRIMPDHLAICRQVIEYFLHQGLERFVVFNGLNPVKPNWVQYRTRVFTELVATYGFAAEVIQSFDDFSPLMEESPIAAFCVSDKYAREMMTLCDHLNIAVPNAMSIVGVDDDPLESSLSPRKISSVHFSAQTMGSSAVNELAKLFREPKSRSINEEIHIEPKPISIGHTSRALQSDGLVNDAMVYIRQNFHTGIKADQVARHLCVSRSHLNERFNQCLNQTVHHFLLLERLNFVVEQLTQSNHSISSISEQVGFSSKNYLFKCFKQHYGMSPQAYRDTHMARP